ncbi:ABC transporter substrate-binding protein [Moheibacter stercoris]|uniref:Iron complex transport system substrate-binding protein n=1 Tax=Moheibacter stercoris TaxID=1628251 RepID=A0ABV2LWI4_9FLAO
MKNFIFFITISSLILACKQNSNSNISSRNTQNFDYIENLQWKEAEEQIEIESGGIITILSKKDLPLKSVMVVPTSVLAYMSELGLEQNLTGVSQIKYIYNPKIQELHREQKIEEIGNFNELYFEKIILNKPDVFFTTSSPSLAKFHDQLKNQGIKIIFIDEYEEQNPLAKAEYVKVIGRLLGKEKQADSIFQVVETNYKNLQKKLENQKKKSPKVLVNQIYSDIWYLPSGESFQAKLIADAGGEYPWKSTTGINSLNLSFESVFEKAEDAEVWINAGDFPSRAALLVNYPHYEWFQAFQNNQVYNWHKRSSPSGGNDYFETGTARPDWVLKDLAAIFHPELFPNYELRFYQKLN